MPPSVPQPPIIPVVRGESLAQGANRVVQRLFIIRVPRSGSQPNDPLASANCPKRGDLLQGGAEFSSFQKPALVASEIRSVKYIGYLPNATGGNDDTYEIVVEYSDKFNTGIDTPQTWTYSREEFKVPFFRNVTRFYPLTSGATFTPPAGCPAAPAGLGYKFEWVEDPLTIYVPFGIYTRTVWVPTGSLTYAARAKIRKEIGKLHLFGPTANPQVGDDDVELARFEPPRIVQEDRRYTRIEYAWMTDPGNGPIAGDTEPCKRYIVPTIPRPPWHRYRVIPAANRIDPPEIVTFDTMPAITGNPFFVAGGQNWKALIGLNQIDGAPI